MFRFPFPLSFPSPPPLLLLQVLIELVLTLKEELVQLHLLLAHALKCADNLLFCRLCGLGFGGAPAKENAAVSWRNN
jgi:hypothetical protein